MCTLGLVVSYQQILDLKLPDQITYDDFCLLLKQLSEQ